MKKRGKLCYRCQYFSRYFTKDMKQFNSTDCGWCRKKVDIVSAYTRCEKYTTKPNRKKSYSALKVCLNDLLTELSVIRQFIEAENAETAEQNM